MKNKVDEWWILLFLSLIFCDCQTSVNRDDTGDSVIVEVGNRKLYASELNQIIHPDINPADSAAVANAYIDQWVRDKLLMQEAARSFSSDFKLESLVEDYREKLLKFKLEEKILNERYDTIVTETQMRNFYETHKEGFVQDEALYKCWLTKFPVGQGGTRQFRRDWNNDKTEAILAFIEANNIESAVDTNRWYTWKQIEAWCPTFVERRIKTVKNQRKIFENNEFYLKVQRIVDKGDNSPLDYVKLQLKLMILHKRKQDIIESYKQELYEKALEANVVKL